MLLQQLGWESRRCAVRWTGKKNSKMASLWSPQAWWQFIILSHINTILKQTFDYNRYKVYIQGTRQLWGNPVTTARKIWGQCIKASQSYPQSFFFQNGIAIQNIRKNTTEDKPMLEPPFNTTHIVTPQHQTYSQQPLVLQYKTTLPHSTC